MGWGMEVHDLPGNVQVCRGPAEPQVLGSPSPRGLLQVNPAQVRIQPIPWRGSPPSLPSPVQRHLAAPKTPSASCPQAEGTGHRRPQERVCFWNMRGHGHDVTAAPWHLSWRCQ